MPFIRVGLANVSFSFVCLYLTNDHELAGAQYILVISQSGYARLGCFFIGHVYAVRFLVVVYLDFSAANTKSI